RSMAITQYNDFIAQNPPVTGTPEAAMVQRVGSRIVAGVTQYLADKGQSDLVSNYQWEINLVNNPEVNAWCLPGGKIVIYTGILAYATDYELLAVVMGHEVAHAVLKHGNE